MDRSVLGYFDVFLLVFARMGGMIFIHPVFARRGIPSMVKVGLTLTLSLLIAPTAAAGSPALQAAAGTFGMAEALLREVIMGLVIGSLFQLFFYMIFVAGDLLDTVFGLAMGKVLDPAGGVQSAMLGQFINVFFYLYFFATGCHLLTVRLFAYTYEIVPAGAATLITRDMAWYLAGMFGSVFAMAVKLAVPFVAAEFVLEVSMGVLMKLIPQIHVFVINIQSKIILGMILMLLFARPIGAFLDGYFARMMGEAQNVMLMFAK